MFFENGISKVRMPESKLFEVNIFEVYLLLLLLLLLKSILLSYNLQLMRVDEIKNKESMDTSNSL